MSEAGGCTYCCALKDLPSADFLLDYVRLVDGKTETPVRLVPHFSSGATRFYAPSVPVITYSLNEGHEPSAGVLSPRRNPVGALKKMPAARNAGL